jgi:glycosyltransferase involved in cell wall biosynthesis
MSTFRACVLIPTYDNPQTIRGVVEQARAHLSDVIVIDDGSHAAGRAACAELARDGFAVVHHCLQNGGKGAAVKAGFALARKLGFTHAVQVDGDGQHDLSQIPAFLTIAQAHPEALVLGTPVYDHTLNRGRYMARLVTRFWNYLEVLGPTIGDSMCGFRVYPIDAAIASGTRGNRMDFDIEIPVRMVWQRVPVINAEVRVRYLTAEEGGISHYQTFRDTALISWTHTKLMIEVIFRLLTWPARRLLGSGT